MDTLWTWLDIFSPLIGAVLFFGIMGIIGFFEEQGRE